MHGFGEGGGAQTIGGGARAYPCQSPPLSPLLATGLHIACQLRTKSNNVTEMTFKVIGNVMVR